MGAQIHQFVTKSWAGPAAISVTPRLQAVPNNDSFHFWSGASGQRYVHTIYGLRDCPELPNCVYVLVRSDDNGRRTALRIGCADQTATSLNLALVRQRAAQLGANEIHVHMLAETHEQRMISEFDLQAGQFGALSAEPAAAVCH